MLEPANDLRQSFPQRGPFAFVPLDPVVQALALRGTLLKACFRFGLGLPHPLILLDKTLHPELQLIEFVKVHETNTKQILKR